MANAIYEPLTLADGGATSLVVSSSDNTIVQNGSSTLVGRQLQINLSAVGDGTVTSVELDYTGNELTSTVNALSSTPVEIDGSTILTKDPYNDINTDSQILDDVLGVLNTTRNYLIKTNVTGSMTITNQDLVVIQPITPGNADITLPDATSVSAKKYFRINLEDAASSFTLIPVMGQMVNGNLAGAPELVFSGANYLNVAIFSDGANWTLVSDVTSVTLASFVNNMTSTVNGLSSTPASIINTNALSSVANTLTSTVNGVATAPVSLVNSISNTSSTNNLSTTVNGVGGSTVNIINSNALNSAVNTLTSTVNGVAASGVSLINSNSSAYTGNTLTNTLNGIASTPVTLNGTVINTIDPTTSSTHVLNNSLANIYAAIPAAVASLAPYIVGTTGVNNFSTITAAITQAVTDGATTLNPLNLYIKPGFYVENFNLPAGINLIALDGISDGLLALSPSFPNPQHCSVKITGTITPTGGSGDVSYIKGCELITPTNGTGCAPSGNNLLLLENCAITLQDNSSVFLNPTSACTVSFVNCSYPRNHGRLYALTTTTYLSFINSNLASAQTPTHSSGDITIFSRNSQLVGAGLDFSGSSVTFDSTDTDFGPITSSATLAGTMRGGSHFGITAASGDLYLQNVREVVVSAGGANFIKEFCRTTISSQACVAKLSSNFNGSDYFVSQANVQTSNATSVKIPCTALNNNETYTVTGRVTATDSTHTKAIGGSFTATAQRAAGNISLVGILVAPVLYSTGTGTFTVIADTSSQAIAVQATGELGTVYNWVVTFEYHKVLTFS